MCWYTVLVLIFLAYFTLYNGLQFQVAPNYTQLPKLLSG